ncbi:MAG: DUF4124 domain-containing protein [Woeseiaceae bacterium]|nr:DUF4124 domain-containing protein [Woeseiaceae bacterium]
MTSKHLLVALAAGALLSVPALANEVYKWTDAEGNVHYEDRPAAGANPERIALTYKRTDPGQVAAQKKSLEDKLVAREESRVAEAEAAQAAAARAAEEAERQNKCDAYRAKLETFANSRRLYRVDENGERAFLEDDEIQKTRERAEALVAEHCTS